jgi:hypothetical protein
VDDSGVAGLTCCGASGQMAEFTADPTDVSVGGRRGQFVCVAYDGVTTEGVEPVAVVGLECVSRCDARLRPTSGRAVDSCAETTPSRE